MTATCSGTADVVGSSDADIRLADDRGAASIDSRGTLGLVSRSEIVGRLAADGAAL